MSCPELRGKRIARVASVKFAIDHVTSQVEALAREQAIITVICSPANPLPRPATLPLVDFVPVLIERSISPVRDLLAVFKLWRIFRDRHFDIVHSTTPKAGLLTAIAARLAQAPIRVHTFTGQVWATQSGLARHVLKVCDRIIAALSTALYADSRSQIEFLEAEGVAKPGRIKLLGSGSVDGVDTARFASDKFSAADNSATRSELHIPDNAKVLIFIGRLHVEKGLRELFGAYTSLAGEMPDLHLVLAGPNEQSDDLFSHSVTDHEMRSRVHFLGSVPDPERYLAISHLLCLPTYREGFPTVVLEAASLGVPTVASDIYGVRDAVVDGETGILVPPREIGELRSVISQLLTSASERREQLGESARQRVRREYDKNVVSGLILQEYVRLLRSVARGDTTKA